MLTDKQRKAQIRNWRIYRLRGFQANMRVLAREISQEENNPEAAKLFYLGVHKIEKAIKDLGICLHMNHEWDEEQEQIKCLDCGKLY